MVREVLPLVKILAVASLALLMSAVPAAAKKVALVIGNADYTSVRPLLNPHQDAEMVADAFRALGFEVLTGNDLDQAQFASLLVKFDEALDGTEAAAFYYAGHGIQFEGENYLISTNATLDSPLLLSSETIPLDAIIDVMEAKSPVNMVFLDACRDNPFVERLQAKLPATRSAATQKGLAPALGFGAETMIMYATASNAVALDGDSKNSPFATALVKHLRAPDTEIGLVMKRVIRDVKEATAGQQSPEMLTSVSIELYLNLTVIAEKQRPKGVLSTAEAQQQFDQLLAASKAAYTSGDLKANYDAASRALDIAVMYFGEDSAQYASANNRIIGTLTQLGRIDDAIYAASEAIRVNTILYGKDSMPVLSDMANMAGRLKLVGRIEEAENLYTSVIKTYESKDLKGDDVRLYAHALEGYAQYKAQIGKTAEAVALASKSAEVIRASDADGLIDYGWIIGNYGDILRSAGRCTEAVAVFAEAVAAYRKAGVPEHHNDLAHSLEESKRVCP